VELSCPVVLASGSPRRRELLRSLFEHFEILVPEVDETLRAKETLHQATQRLAQIKARAVAQQRPDALIIAADTLVGYHETILGKPATPEEALDMLAQLSSRTHSVVTGVAIIHKKREVVFVETTRVTFRRIKKQEALNYVATGEPMDKAGAYAIQGGAADFVERMEGSRSNVVGLPLERLEAELNASFREH
jgi:septum formation protein